MTYHTPPNLSFFKNDDKQSHLNGLNTKVSNVIKQCRIHLTVVTDDSEKEKLTNIIKHSSALLWAVQQEKDKKTILNHLEALQESALVLPTQLTTKKRLSTKSHAIAQTCLFLLVLSVAMAVGLAFYAAYFSVLTWSIFMEGLITELAIVGIPAGGLGLFAYGLYSSDQKTESSSEVSQLQEDINQVCETVNDAHYPEAVVVAESNKVAQLKAL
jgi:hypothetical protein